MRKESAWRRLARIVALALLLIAGGVGVYNGPNEVRAVTNGLQVLVAAGVVGYGALGIAAAVAAWRRSRATSGLVTAWGAAVTMVATLAPIAYGGPDVPIIGALAGGLATALLAAGIWWATRPRDAEVS